MREIKFRAWHFQKRKMYEVKYEVKSVDFFFGLAEIQWWTPEPGGTKRHNYKTVMFTDGITEKREVELMQYTGLKDKNGKEIYEGDIVKIRDEEMIFTDIWGDEGQSGDDWNVIETNIVRFENGAFVIGSGFETKCISEYSTQKGYSIEVIGNIYQNPELLKK